MKDDPRVREIMVGVTPRLLSDALSLALRGEGLEVVQYPDEIEGDCTPRFDVALVCGDLPDDIMADTVLVLGPSGTLLTPSRERQEHGHAFRDEVADLVDLLEDLLGGNLVES